MHTLRGLVFVLFITTMSESFADDKSFKNKINYEQVHKIINTQLALIHKEMDRIMSMKNKDIKGKREIKKLYGLIYPRAGRMTIVNIEEELCELEGSDTTIFGDNCLSQGIEFGTETTKLLISKIYKPDMPTKFTLEEIKKMELIQSHGDKSLYGLKDKKRNILIGFSFDKKKNKYIFEMISIRPIKDGADH